MKEMKNGMEKSLKKEERKFQWNFQAHDIMSYHNKNEIETNSFWSQKQFQLMENVANKKNV